MPALAVAAVLASAHARSHPAQPPNTFVAALRAAHADPYHSKRDRFTGLEAADRFSDQPFTLDLPIVDKNSLAGSDAPAVWDYDKLLQLQVRFRSERGLEARGLETIETIPLARRDVGASSYIGQNAFGARAHVRAYDTASDALAVLRAPIYDGPSTDRYSEFVYAATVSIAPAEARVFVRHVRLRISGHIRKLDNGHIFDCGVMYSAATISSPTALSGTTCWVGAQIEKIGFYDDRDGGTIREWPESPAREGSDTVVTPASQ